MFLDPELVNNLVDDKGKGGIRFEASPGLQNSPLPPQPNLPSGTQTTLIASSRCVVHIPPYTAARFLPAERIVLCTFSTGRVCWLLRLSLICSVSNS